MRKVLIIATALFAAAGQVHAGESNRVNAPAVGVELVRFQTAELAGEDGIRTLRNRIRAAAWRVCKHEIAVSSFYTGSCVIPAARDANAQLDMFVERWHSGALAGATALTVRAR